MGAKLVIYAKVGPASGLLVLPSKLLKISTSIGTANTNINAQYALGHTLTQRNTPTHTKILSTKVPGQPTNTKFSFQDGSRNIWCSINLT